MSAVLVTGGAGYIGSHAVKALRARGETVIVYDNFSQGHRAATRNASAVVEGDIQDAAKLAAVLKTHKVDAVMHFAAWLSVGDSVKDPIGYYRNNVSGALSVAEAMVTAGVKHLVFSSTCAIFGTPETTPIHEDLPKRPINAYGETKLAIEYALPHFEIAYGIRTRRAPLLQRRRRRSGRRARRGSRAGNSRHPQGPGYGDGAGHLPHFWR